MIDPGNTNINEFYESTRKKIEIAKMLLKTFRPLDELLTNALHSYGTLPQAFTAIYQLHQTMQLFHDEIKLEEITAEMKKYDIKRTQNIHHLSWGKLPSFNSNSDFNAFEHQLQVILTAKDWISLRKIIKNTSRFLILQFIQRSTDMTMSSQFSVEEYNLDTIHEEIRTCMQDIMTSFHYHATKGLSGEVLLEILEKIHGDVMLLNRFLLMLESLTFLSCTMSKSWMTLNTVKSELNRKIATIDSILEAQKHQDVNLFLSVLELSRQANQVVKEVETLNSKVEVIIRDLTVLSKLLSALQRTAESHPLYELALQFSTTDSMEVES